MYRHIVHTGGPTHYPLHSINPKLAAHMVVCLNVFDFRLVKVKKVKIVFCCVGSTSGNAASPRSHIALYTYIL